MKTGGGSGALQGPLRSTEFLRERLDNGSSRRLREIARRKSPGRPHIAHRPPRKIKVQPHHTEHSVVSRYLIPFCCRRHLQYLLAVTKLQSRSHEAASVAPLKAAGTATLHPSSYPARELAGPPLFPQTCHASRYLSSPRRAVQNILPPTRRAVQGATCRPPYLVPETIKELCNA